MQKNLAHACALAAVVAVSACGGGGGSGGSSGSAPGPGPSGTTGLIPSAPAKGAVLQADARTLRPLRAGATWTYRGQYKTSSASTPVSYVTETTHLAAGGGITEVGDNVDDQGAQSVALSDTGGTIVSTGAIDFTGTPETVASIELRSPVQVGDQYTVVDRRIPDVGVDVDGDGKPDALDVAIWSRVVGSETLAFPNTPALDAVAVDTFVAVRLLASSTGQWSDPVQGVSRVWYAPGIGVVRRTTDIPNETGTERTTTDEWLVAWDAQTEGYGAMPPVPAVAPSGGPGAGTALLGGPSLKAAFAFADGAVVVTHKLDAFAGSLMSRLDLRGNVVSVHDYPGDRFVDGPFAAHANGFVYVSRAPSDIQATFRQFDSNGVESAPSGATIDLGGGRFGATVSRVFAAGDGATIWLAWQRSWVNVGVGFVNDVVLRAYDIEGNPVTPELALLADAGLVGIAASGGRVLVTFTHNDGSGPAAYYAEATTASTVAAVAGAALPPTSGGGASPVLLDLGGALFFADVTGGAAVVSGVRLDGSFMPVLGSGGAWSGQALGTIPANAVATSTGGTAILAGATMDTLWPDSSFAEPLLVAAWYPPGTTQLSLAAPRVVRTPGRFDAGSVPLAFPDRLMLLGNDVGGNALVATVVWLR